VLYAAPARPSALCANAGDAVAALRTQADGVVGAVARHRGVRPAGARGAGLGAGRPAEAVGPRRTRHVRVAVPVLAHGGCVVGAGHGAGGVVD